MLPLLALKFTYDTWSNIHWTHRVRRYLFKLFSWMRWTAGLTQLSIMYGMLPCCMPCIILWLCHQHNYCLPLWPIHTSLRHLKLKSYFGTILNDKSLRAPNHASKCSQLFMLPKRFKVASPEGWHLFYPWFDDIRLREGCINHKCFLKCQN